MDVEKERRGHSLACSVYLTFSLFEKKFLNNFDSKLMS